MKTTAYLRHLRVAPRKVRMVTDLIRGKKYEEAQRILSFAIKRGSEPVLKLLNSAAANAKQKFNAETQNLKVAKITVDEGPKLKRIRPRARGQAYQIQKKTSHITLVLEEITPTPEGKAAAKPAAQAAVTTAEKPVAVETEGTPKVTPKEAPVRKPLQEEKRRFQGIRALPKIFRRKAI